MRECYRDGCDLLTSNKKFCSQRCTALHNNVAFPKRKAATTICVVCGESFRKQPSRTAKTCSRKCLSDGKISGILDSHFPKPEELFIRSEKVSRQVVKFWIVRWGILDLKCSRCGIVEWMGEPAPIQLDHINGDKHDHRLENLRMLCANCHCLTPTYGNKNNRRKTITGRIPSP